MKITNLIVAAGVIGIVACSTVPVDRAINVSVAGKAYVDTLKKVNELALDTSIEFTANLLPSLPRNKETLKEQTEEIGKRSELIGSANEYLDRLANYFTELEALSRGDQSEATAKAVGQLADSLKAEPMELSLSAEKKKALTGLAGFVAKQFHAAAVEKALIRDADVVAQALAISENMLDEEIRWIMVRETADRRKKYIENIEKPFIAGGPLSSEWKKAWSAEVRTPPVAALLVEAKTASADLQKAWINVLRGQYSYSEILASLRNVQAGIDAVTALKNAN